VETPIRIGVQFNEMVEILDGVKAGDKVVNRPPKRLENGSRIKMAEK
jgi:multidrug efflux pump subunit AcrA (membrane-fusion protein)